jgi:hypothetical protein
MGSGTSIVHNGEVIWVRENETHWELKYLNGSREKIFYHLNADKHALWMWECGRIDEAAFAIGRLIEEMRVANRSTTL